MSISPGINTDATDDGFYFGEPPKENVFAKLWYWFKDKLRGLFC